MSKVVVIPDEVITHKIFLIRNQKVLLDRDLAALYGVENKYLKRQVRRNKERFPKDFMFELSSKEFEILRSQNGSSSWGGTRYAPMAFTEQGVAMLSSVIKSPLAVKVNIQIIRVFIKIRTSVSEKLNTKLELDEIKQKVSKNSQHLELVFRYLDKLIEKKDSKEPRKRIGYKK
jgi:hypothetical protein